LRSEDSGKVPPHPAQGPSAPAGAGALSPTGLSLEQAARVQAGAVARHRIADFLQVANCETTYPSDEPTPVL